MKTFQKLKKWLAGLTSALLLASILAPSYTIAAITADTVTVDIKVTNDQTPSLSGTMSNLTDLVSVTVNSVTYAATNNGDNTWTLADNVVPEAFALPEGVYDVTVSTFSGATDTTIDELTIDLTGPELMEVVPVPKYTNLENPTYEFSSNESGTITYDGLCGEGDITSVVQGNNVVRFGPYSILDEGLYDDCQIAVTDAAGNSTKLNVSPFTVDMTAPVVMTYAEFSSREQNTQKVAVVAEPKINDNGVYIEEDSEDVSVVTKWEAVTPATEGSIRSYKVTYVVTDAAGNVTSSTPFAVELTNDEFDIAVGSLPLTLIGDQEVTHERDPLYTDFGVNVKDWDSPTVHVWTYGNLDILKTGEYGLEYRASAAMLVDATASLSPATPAPSALREVTVVDTIGPDAVTNLKAFGGNGYVQLTWVNPVNDDLAGLNIYRSTEADVRGTVIANALSPEAVSFDDYSVVNGETYYYTVAAFDSAANNGKDSLQVSAMSQSPKVAAATTSYYDYEVAEEPEAQEVKSDETENKTEVEDENQVPVIGVIILVLLILLGLYLLYLQSPSWFSWMFFWKKNPKSNKKK